MNNATTTGKIQSILMFVELYISRFVGTVEETGVSSQAYEFFNVLKYYDERTGSLK